MRNDDLLGPCERIFNASVKQAADVGDVFQNESSIAAVDGVQTDVRIALQSTTNGAIEISFYSADDLERVMGLIIPHRTADLEV